MLADQAVVDGADAIQLIGPQRLKSRGGRVLRRLFGAARAGDDRADAGLIDHPAQRELSQRRPWVEQRFELASGGDADIEGYASEGLAHVEGFAVTVEVTVVVGAERRVLVVTAGQDPRGERHPGDDPHARLPSGGQ